MVINRIFYLFFKLYLLNIFVNIKIYILKEIIIYFFIYYIYFKMNKNIKKRLITLSAKSINLKLDSINYNINTKKKLNELYHLIGGPGFSYDKNGLINNKPPIKYNLSNISNSFDEKNIKTYHYYSLSNSQLKNKMKITSFSDEKLNNNKKNKQSLFNLFKPVQSIKKNNLKEHIIKKNNKFLNKAFYKGKLQNLSNRLFGYIKVKNNKNYDKEIEDPFFSKDNINQNKFKNRQRLFSDNDILLSKYNSNYNSPKYSFIF